MLKPPAISIVMGVYNGERYLREAVDSILCQTYTDFEFIVINDGSTDGTQGILESYSDTRLVLINQENIGLTKSLNKGITLAKGKYIARQDADDVSESERLQKQIEFLMVHPDVSVVGTAATLMGPAGQPLGDSTYACEHEAIVNALGRYNCFWHGSTMFLKSAFDGVGGYSEIFTATQDYDLWLRMSENYRTANLKEPLYRYRFNPDAVTFRRIVIQKKLADVARALARARAMGEKESPVLEAFAASKDTLTSREKMEIFAAYRGWVQILYSHSLVADADVLARKIVGYYPSPAFRLVYWVTSLIDRRRALQQLLEVKV